jgi:hypothetical protein
MQHSAPRAPRRTHHCHHDELYYFEVKDRESLPPNLQVPARGGRGGFD